MRALLTARCLACCFLALCMTQAAFAQDADADARARAASHWKSGVAHASHDEYAEALADFEAAYRLAPRAATLYNIALTQVGLGRTAGAVQTLQRYLAEPAEPNSEPKRKAARRLLVELLAKLDKAEKVEKAAPAASAVATAQLTIVIFPYGKVWIDGAAAGDSPVTKSLPAGAHRVTGGREQPELLEDVVLESGAAKRVVLAWGRKELVTSTTGATPSAP